MTLSLRVRFLGASAGVPNLAFDVLQCHFRKLRLQLSGKSIDRNLLPTFYLLNRARHTCRGRLARLFGRTKDFASNFRASLVTGKTQAAVVASSQERGG